MYDIDISRHWETAWSALTRLAGGGLTTVMAWVGLAIVASSVVVLIWRKFRRKGEQGQAGMLGWAIAFGAILAGPDLLIPLVLNVVDAVANVAVGMWKASQDL